MFASVPLIGAWVEHVLYYKPTVIYLQLITTNDDGRTFMRIVARHGVLLVALACISELIG
jgi:hypothetical protein